MSGATADHSAAAMQASAEGQMALVTGDVVLAKAKYAEAGDILRRDGDRLRKASEKHLQQFLAATQYYLGGHYQLAHDMAKRIEPRFLTPHVGGLLPQFLRDTKARSAPSYERQVRKTLQGAYEKSRPDSVLSILQNHPYVLDSAGLSFMRAVSCEQLGDYRAAALFYCSARRFVTTEIGLLLNTIIYPLRLPSQGHLDEAWEYAQHQVELIPHPITFTTASILCYRRAAAVQAEERDRLFKQQIGYMEQAWEGYQTLSEADQAHVDVKPYVSLGLVTGAHAWLQLGNSSLAIELCDTAIALAPDTAAPWTMRGTITHPSPEAVTDFEKASTLPDAGHIPYAMLAANAWGQRDASAALAYCQRALTHNPEPESAAKLYGWMAACRSILGAPVKEIDRLYKRALAISPDHKEVRANYELFLAHVRSASIQASRLDYSEVVIEVSTQEFGWPTELHFSRHKSIDDAVSELFKSA